jgi:aminopeptidase N
VVSSARLPAAFQPTSLKHTEARARAAMVDVTSYDVALDLDRGEETFGAVSTIHLVSLGGATFLEVRPVALNSMTVNGRPVDVTLLEDGRVPIETEPGENHVVVDSVMRYRHDGEGLHRAIDPADGRHYTYAMPFLDAAPSIFACFDQPDLKAAWTLRVRTPQDWVVLGNSPATEVEPGQWELAPTLPLSTYLVALVAGPYHVLRDEHDGIPLGLSARASIAKHLDHDAEEIFTVTAQCFDEFHRLFGMRYPFGNYHQAFVPEFNAGAMESAGCVTLRDPLVFQSRVVRTFHTVRASTIAHEMAHMWFGDIVTPRWWDDLWLNESFAEYMGARVTADVTEFREVWVTEAYNRRSWGLSADQRPSTHPVAGNGAGDAAIALQNFDGISYAKGASILKQFNSRLGDEVFFGGVRDHFEKHRYGNASMTDLLDAWERAGAGDLTAFRDGWLLTAGPDKLELDRAGGRIRRTPLEGHPADRDHTLGVARATTEHPGTWQVDRLQVDADAVEAVASDGPVVLDPHVETWAVTLHDPETLAALPQVLPATSDPLLRASAWLSVRNAFQHGRLDPEAALDLLEAALPAEDTDAGVGQTLGWAIWDVMPLAADPAAALARIHDVAARCVAGAEPGGSLQLAAFQVQVAAADDLSLLREWLEGGAALPDGAVVDLDLRWRILRTLARYGGIDRHELDEALDAEPTGLSKVEHARALASIPDAEAKAWAWERFTGEVEAPNYELEAIGLGLWQVGQERLTDPYVDRYFDDVPATSAVRSGMLLGLVSNVFYPRWSVSEQTVSRAHAVLSSGDLDSAIRRELVDETWDLERRLAIRRTFQR